MPIIEGPYTERARVNRQGIFWGVLMLVAIMVITSLLGCFARYEKERSGDVRHEQARW